MHKRELYILALRKHWASIQTKPGFGIGISNVTPAHLRDYCKRRIFEEKLLPLEDSVYHYFNQRGNKEELIIYINTHGADKLKPVKQFLDGSTSYPTNETMEMAAWIIHFKPRPYSNWLDQSTNQSSTHDQPKQETVRPQDNHQGGSKEHAHRREHFLQNWLKKQGVLWGCGAAILTASIFGILNIKPSIRANETEESGCMIWVVDHFEPISCDEGIDREGVAKLNSVHLHDFKKITSIETIEHTDIDNIWYYKYNQDSLEYFSAPGLHPLNRQKTLRPMTNYMYLKYIYPRKNYKNH
jgi:hypothetical protein